MKEETDKLKKNAKIQNDLLKETNERVYIGFDDRYIEDEIARIKKISDEIKAGKRPQPSEEELYDFSFFEQFVVSDWELEQLNKSSAQEK